MVDRRRQALEEPVEGGAVGGVEGRGAERVELECGALEALGIAGGEDDVGPLGTCGSGRFQADAGAAADDDDGLPEQGRLALRGSAGGRGGHDASVFDGMHA